METTNTQKTNSLSQYKPLFIIIGLIALASLINSTELATGKIFGRQFMVLFMATFFFVFSGFKLLDIAGFAKGYNKYDLLAKHWYGYGYVYPFIELALGISYLIIPTSNTLHLVTAIVMAFGGIGVSIKIAKKEQFTCACLGTFINVPLTYVTIVENFGMALMAIMLLAL